MKLYKAGESHGEAMVAVLTGVPSGIAVDEQKINDELRVRSTAFGRSARQQIEKDELALLTGTHRGVTSGNNMAFVVKNAVKTACVYSENGEQCGEALPPITNIRPGHADLPGLVKYRLDDARSVAEGASARNTCLDVAAGGVALAMLKMLGISVKAFVRAVGGVKDCADYAFENINAVAPLFSADGGFDEAFKKETLRFTEKGDSVGGTVEIRVCGVKAGFGGYTAESRIDGAIARDLFNIQAIKGVYFGLNPYDGMPCGSEYADEIIYGEDGKKSLTKKSGGIDGGMTNGGEIVITVGVKPLPTTRLGVPSVDVFGNPCISARERADTTAVFALCPVLKAVVAMTVADFICQSLGYDNMKDVCERYQKR